VLLEMTWLALQLVQFVLKTLHVRQLGSQRRQTPLARAK